MKNKLIGAIATAVAIAFVAVPVTSAWAHKVPCYGVDTCKDKENCKNPAMIMKSAKKCAKMGGSTEAPKAADNAADASKTAETPKN